jgi:hypothetical protein
MPNSMQNPPILLAFSLSVEELAAQLTAQLPLAGRQLLAQLIATPPPAELADQTQLAIEVQQAVQEAKLAKQDKLVLLTLDDFLNGC